MTALPADIAKYTTDGFLLNAPPTPAAQATVTSVFPDAQAGNEIEMFYDNVADAQAMLNEKYAYVSAFSPVHEGVEVEDSLGLGTTLPVAPRVPTFRIIDESRGIDTFGRVAGYAYTMGSDRYSVEVIALRPYSGTWQGAV